MYSTQIATEPSACNARFRLNTIDRGGPTMSQDSLPTIKYLQECLRYENGKLFWLIRPNEHFNSDYMASYFNARYAGKEAGCLSMRCCGKRHSVTIRCKSILRSRIVWAMHNGRWPVNFIDHINRIPTDDRIENLREATSEQNGYNKSRNSNNISGFKGVSWFNIRSKWKATITINRKRKHLGYFASPEKAYQAYCIAAKQHHGEFSCTGEKGVGT